MTITEAQRIRDLERHLSEANATIHALVSGQVDAVVDGKTQSPLLLARAQEALRDSEANYRRIVETTTEGVWVVDELNRTTFMNRRMAQWLGCESDMGQGRSPADFLDVQAGQALMRAHAGPPIPQQHELRYIRPDGTSIWALVDETPMVDSTGRSRGWLAMAKDITERRALEAQYLQAQKMEVIGHLAGGVAHDFNNLLTVILGFCELVLDRDRGQPHRDDVLEIQKAGTRAAVLTRQLLTFSRKQIVEPARLDLNLVVVNLESMIARLIGEDVHMVLRLPPALAVAWADRGQVEQVLINLAVNARDAMPHGGTLTIETADAELDALYAGTHPGVTPGAYVSVTVSDTGTGMTPEVRARLFEPFFTTKEEGKGTGLGLATVHRIASRGGGSVSVCSELGVGTSFVVYFPRDETPAEVVVEGGAASQAVRGTETILVVEDADGVRELVSTLLERQGYRILLAASPEEARVLFRKHSSIALILTDVVMPGTSGPALIVELLEQRPRLKVVYMSGYSEEAIVNRGLFTHAVTFLHKPFTADALGRTVRDVLDR